MNIENKSVNELMELLLSKDVSNKDKIKINKKLKKCLSYKGNCIKNIISLDNYFLKNKDKLDNYLYDTEIPDYVKKYIIKYFSDADYFIELLNKDISYNLKSYIISEGIIYSGIITILKKDDIDDKIKKLCIDKKVNSFNIVSLILDKDANDTCRDYILSSNKNKIKFIMALLSMSKKELLYKLTYDYNIYDSDKIIKKYRPNIYNNASSGLSERYIRASFYKKNININLFDKVFYSDKKKVFKIINGIKGKDALDWLKINELPNEYADIIINNNTKYLNKYVDSMNIDDVLIKLKIYTSLSIGFKDLLLKRRFDDLVEILNNYDIDKYISFVSDYYYNDDIILRTMDNKFIDEEIIYNLGYYCKNNKKLFDLMIKYKNNLIINILDNINWDKVINDRVINDEYMMGLTSLPNNVQKWIYNVNEKYIMNNLSNFDRDVLYGFLECNSRNSSLCNSIKTSIIGLLNGNNDNLGYYKILLKYDINENVLEAFRKIEIFLSSNNVTIKSFFQYGEYNFSNIVNSILNIVNNDKLDNFILVRDYIINEFYITESGPLVITNLNKLIIKYCIYEELLLNIAKNNISLGVNDRNNLKLLFNTNEFGMVNNLIELEENRRNKLKEYKDIILNGNIGINEIKKIFFDKIIVFDSSIFDNIGDIASLRILQKDNKDNMEMYYLIEEVINSMDLINKLTVMNDREKLVNIIVSYIDGDDVLINNAINRFININDRVRRLYELDSMYNLTTLDMARKVQGIYNEEYMKLYGGEVFDFSDKNYVLYAHVKSDSEKLDNLINGVSTGNSNFISFSPISYKGQKYYYNYEKCIFAYDRILDNSFVYSSLTNMGSNSFIEKNSAIVGEVKRNQRGILETSSVTKQNAESLFYREGLKPCGIILINGKKPNNMELECHNKYNLPFIITQTANTMIENVKMVFESNKGNNVLLDDIERINSIKKYMDSNLVVKKENDIYTGREIALFTDVHAMYEPAVAILEDIRYRGINEIYSLGDNTSVGPNPREVLDLLDKYNVKQVMGNDEYYLTLGSEPFTYFDEERERSLEWTYDKVSDYISNLKLYKPSLDIVLGDKKIALCHFVNDIRWDYNKHNTFTYQSNFGNVPSQFLYTNSDKYKEEIEHMINKYGINNPRVRGCLSSKNEPLFSGKMITSYDDVFEGHVHYEFEDKLYNTNIYTLRGAGMGEIDNNKKDKAYYLVLKERKDGNFDIERVFVPFNKKNLLSNVYASGMPVKSKILKYLK